MTLEAARLATLREYDEPFEILKGDPDRLFEAIVKRKKRWTRGGTFYHILGSNDKAHCVNLLIHYYRRAFEHVSTVGLGDGPNDAEFLKLVDLPLVLESPSSKELQAAIRHAQLCPGSGGPAAWNSAVLNAVKRHYAPKQQPANLASEEKTCSTAAGL
jgi:mannosyl-3-phosphoglycerate phosphatase